MLSDIVHSYFDWIFNMISRIFGIEHYEYQEDAYGNETKIIINRIRYEAIYMLAYLIGIVLIIFIAIILFFIVVYFQASKGEG